MKRSRLVTLLIGMTLAASGAFAIGSAISSKKAEVVDAVDYSGTIILQKNDNDMKYTGSKLVAYFFDDNFCLSDSIRNKAFVTKKNTIDFVRQIVLKTE